MDEKEKFFLELIDGFVWKYDNDEYPCYLFMFKNNVCLFEIYNPENINQKNIIVSYRLNLKKTTQDIIVYTNQEKIISIFQSRFKMSYGEVQIFLAHMIEKYINLTAYLVTIRDLWWAVVMEKHFNGQ